MLPRALQAASNHGNPQDLGKVLRFPEEKHPPERIPPLTCSTSPARIWRFLPLLWGAPNIVPTPNLPFLILPQGISLQRTPPHRPAPLLGGSVGEKSSSTARSRRQGWIGTPAAPPGRQIPQLRNTPVPSSSPISISKLRARGTNPAQSSASPPVTSAREDAAKGSTGEIKTIAEPLLGYPRAAENAPNRFGRRVRRLVPPRCPQPSPGHPPGAAPEPGALGTNPDLFF